ncbi:MAG: radical SAM protein [Syntrophaceae bacterium]|nr:radical SAM protein [Syntrophaceae bacterium]
MRKNPGGTDDTINSASDAGSGVLAGEVVAEFRGSSLIGRLKEWWAFQTMPRLDWVQLEVTTRCNASCRYCPRTVYRSSWIDRDLSWETFRLLYPVMKQTRMVHLQGWGEPLLHPCLFDMIALAKKAGCVVGTTTNGMLLDRRTAVRLVESGVDHVAFSLAGVGDQNDEARRGTRFSAVLEAIAGLAAEKKIRRQPTPVIGVAYLLLRSHLPDIGRMIPALAGVGVQQIVVSTLDFVAHRDLAEEYLAPADQAAYGQLKFRFEQMSEEARRQGLALYGNLVLPDPEGRVCTENPCRAVFVSSDGSISPCAFAGIPAERLSCVAGGKESNYQRLTFGAINNETLPAVWKSAAYREFRASFGRQPHPLCQNCAKRPKR